MQVSVEITTHLKSEMAPEKEHQVASLTSCSIGKLQNDCIGFAKSVC